MRRLLKLILLLLIGLLLACVISFFSDTSQPGQWTFHNKSKIAWSKFFWTNETLDGKYFEKTAMFIPARIPGLPYNFTFQFDLGSGVTMIYENTARKVFAKYPALTDKIKRLRNFLQFWNKQKIIQDFTLNFGEITVKNENCFVKINYGDTTSVNDLNDNMQLHIGTIGADMFQNKVLIIDYPNQQFAICDSVPQNYNAKFVDIELEKSGRVILPMKLKGKDYRITFDNGSSIFPLITAESNISKYSTGPDIDSISISSWGEKHIVTGKIIKDSFELAGQRFSNVKVYANHTGLGLDNATDGMAGNALFWNNTIIIDYKNKKFGVK